MRCAMSTLGLLVWLGWASAGFTAVGPAGATPMDGLVAMVPDSALGAVVINHLGNADLKWKEVARLLRLPLPGLIDALGAAGVKEGLDGSGCAALVLLPAGQTGALPAMVAIVPVTDFGKFIGQSDSDPAVIRSLRLAGVPLLARQIGGYAVLAQQSHRDLLEKLGATAQSTAPDVALWRNSMPKHPVSLVVTRAGVQALLPHLRTATKTAGNPSNSQLTNQILGLAERDLRCLWLGVQWSEARGLWLLGHLRFLADSSTANLLSIAAMDSVNPLERLPAGDFVYALGGRMPLDAGPAASHALAPMVGALESTGGKPQLEAAAETVRRLTTSVQRFAMVLQAAKPGDNVYFHRTNFLEVFEVDDARAFLDLQEKLLGQLLGPQAEGKAARFSSRRVAFDGFPALEVSFRVAPSPEMEDLLLRQYRKRHPEWTGTKLRPPEEFEAQFGLRGEPSIWFVATDQRTVVAGMFRRDLLQEGIKVVARSGPSLARMPEVAEASKFMQGKAMLVGCWSPRGTAASARQVFAQFLPQNTPPLPEFSSKLPIAFLAMKEIDGIGFGAVMPAEVLKAAGQFQETVRAQRAAAEAAR